jgi:hypothetical protein
MHFNSPAISGSNVVVIGGTGLDPSNGHYHGLYTTNLGSHAISKIADVNSAWWALAHWESSRRMGISQSEQRAVPRR